MAPITVSIAGPTFSRSAASSASWTRHRTRARWSARVRTRFWPSHPAAPVTTTVDAGARSAAGVVFGAVTGPCLAEMVPP